MSNETKTKEDLSIDLNSNESTKEVMLTTVDNPYNPFEQFTSWMLFDIEKGYFTCERLMRLANVSDDMSSAEYNTAVDRAMDVLIDNDIMNVFVKVTKDDKRYEKTAKNHQNIDKIAQ